MKTSNILTSALLVILISLVVTINAQDQRPRSNWLRRQMPAANTASQDNNQSQGKRSDLLQALNLTADQVQQIRVINQETRENVRAANMRQRDARRALDAAIYADVPNQTEVEQRARDLANAQAEAVKIRSVVEFRIRQVLTPDQLVRFRELRRQVEQRLRQRLLWRRAVPNQTGN